MDRTSRGARALLACLVASLLAWPPFGAAQAAYHRVAPKIVVPFDPQAVAVLHRSESLFVVEIPHRGYAFTPRIAAFGDRIVFVPGESTLAFTSVSLDGVKMLRIPQDTPGAPPEVRRLAGTLVSFDRSVRVIAFVCEVAPGDLKLAEMEICAMRGDGTGLRRLTRPLRADESQFHHANAPAVSEDGRVVVYRRQGAGYLGAVGTDGTGLRVLVSQADGLTPVALARRAVFYLRGGQVWRAALDGSGARQLTRERGEIRALAVDLDGRRVAYVTRESGRAAGIAVVDGNTGAVLHTIEGVTPPGREWGPDQSLRVSGDGRRLLFAGQYGGRRGVYVVDLATRKVVEVSAGVKAGTGADLNETGEIVVMTRDEDRPLALAFLPDETPPFLWIDEPRPGSRASGESVRVVIRYRDRAVVSGVDPASLAVRVNGRDVSARLETGPERASGQVGRELLKEGENVLEARVRDRAGNETRQTVRFQFVPLLVEFSLAGGIAGMTQRLRVFPDGLARVDSDRAAYCARLEPERLERLRRALDQAGFPGLLPEYRPARPVMDGYTYRVTYQGRTVTTQDPVDDAAPAALRPVIRELAAIVRQVAEQKRACP
ncbi:MAG: hypothetical protein QN173_09830 [Armatimonadota bacterium]|nr:hypothetical protein [Armatimonadota bacterium]MDR7401263.1 hypothetical protein [Armatimonadota bacterium]MDR7402979.1 hypothetical protein [Armatimonadota bacterium]MDR7437157.1 hypothetical protein [Armatimonadota bacterium]MDR7471909.1 hypothetical protein [Armatimonadota bacterium]